MSQTNQCYKCFRIKPIKDFPYHPEMKNKHENRCRDCKNIHKRLWHKNNPDKVRIHRKKYELEVSLGLHPHRREAKNLRSRNRHIITKIINKQKLIESTFIKLFGCSSKVFIARFEKYFKENPGMGWNNYGAWQMDHIKPLKEFELDTEANRKLANHYTNLRPEWGLNNLQKGAKYEMEQTI